MTVLDSSAWVEVLVGRLDLPELADDSVVVPPHFDLEVLGTVRALQQHERVSADDASRALERHLRAPFERVHLETDIREAWHLRESLSFADAWYAAIAKRLGVAWITTDGKAARTFDRLGIPVRVVGDTTA